MVYSIKYKGGAVKFKINVAGLGKNGWEENLKTPHFPLFLRLLCLILNT